MKNQNKSAQDLDCKRLLKIYYILLSICIAFLIAFSLIAFFISAKEWVKILLVVIGLIPLFVTLPFLTKIESAITYYQCPKCNYKYIPSSKIRLISVHCGKMKYLRCPNCKQKSWQRRKLK